MIRPSILLEAFGIACALASMPGTLELLVLTAGGVLPSKKYRSGNAPRSRPIAVVIPAHNEQVSIASCVRSLLACASEIDFYVFVVADNCSDQTAQQAQLAGAIPLIRNDAGKRGKGYALDHAFTILSSEFERFIVIDADTTVTPNLIGKFSAAFDAGAGALQCRYKVGNPYESMRTRWMNIALMAFNVLRPRGRSRFGFSAGVLGNGFGLTRSTLERVPYHAVSVVEDLEYHVRLVRAGIKVKFVDEVTVSADMPSGGKGVVTQRSRWEGGRFRMAIESAPGLLRDVLSGRGRFLEPLLDLLLLPLAFHVAVLFMGLLTPLTWVRDYAAGALLLVAAHLLVAIAVAGGRWTDVGALLVAPIYVIWKLKIIPQLLRNARKSAAWVRTARAAEGGTE